MKKMFKKIKEKAVFTVSLVMASAIIGLVVLSTVSVVSHCVVGY